MILIGLGRTHGPGGTGHVGGHVRRGSGGIGMELQGSGSGPPGPGLRPRVGHDLGRNIRPRRWRFCCWNGKAWYLLWVLVPRSRPRFPAVPRTGEFRLHSRWYTSKATLSVTTSKSAACSVPIRGRQRKGPGLLRKVIRRPVGKHANVIRKWGFWRPSGHHAARYTAARIRRRMAGGFSQSGQIPRP